MVSKESLIDSRNLNQAIEEEIKSHIFGCYSAGLETNSIISPDQTKNIYRKKVFKSRLKTMVMFRYRIQALL